MRVGDQHVTIHAAKRDMRLCNWALTMPQYLRGLRFDEFHALFVLTRREFFGLVPIRDRIYNDASR